MTPTRRTAALTAAVAALALTGCGGGADTTAPEEATGQPAAAETATEDAAAPAAAAEVAIADMAFAPADLTVDAGAEITWTNDDEVPHTVTFDDDTIDSSDQLSQGDGFSTAIGDAGTYDYVCALHPEMTGSVTVR